MGLFGNDDDNPLNKVGHFITNGGVGKVSGANQIHKQIGINDDSVLGNVMGGNAGGIISSSKSHKADKAASLAQQMQDKENEQYEQNKAYAKTLGDHDQTYLGQMKSNVGNYQGDLDMLRGEVQASQKDARNTYTNDVQPRMKNMMEVAQNNAASAMSLKDAMDPNNGVAQSTRDLYERQAQGENKTNLANTATLQALGNQNLGTQIQGAGPMTGGQLAALMGANQAQAGNAYMRSQGRIQDLRDQGLSQGFARSDLAYNRGQQAQDRYGQSVGNYEGAMDRQLGRDTGFRGEKNGLSGQTYGLQQQMNDANRGVANAQTTRDMSLYNTHMGGGQANLAAQIQGINASQAADAAMKTGALSAAGTVAGAYFGGPAGAQAGGQAGQAIGNSQAPTQNAVPQYGSYGLSQPQAAPTMQQQRIGIQKYMNENEPSDPTPSYASTPMPPSSGPRSSYGYSVGQNSGPSNYVQQSSGNGLGLYDPQETMSYRMAQR